MRLLWILIFFAILSLGPTARAQAPSSQPWLVPPIISGDCLKVGAQFGQIADAGAACSGSGSGNMETNGANATTGAQQQIATNAGTASLILGGALSTGVISAGGGTVFGIISGAPGVASVWRDPSNYPVFTGSTGGIRITNNGNSQNNLIIDDATGSANIRGGITASGL